MTVTQERDETIRATRTLLVSPDSQEVLQACRLIAADAVEEIRRSVTPAVRGNSRSVRTYVLACRRLIDALHAGARDWKPELVPETERGLTIADAEGEPARFARIQLMMAAAEAPFSIWASSHEPGDAVILELISRFRSWARGLEPLGAPERESALPHWPGIDDEAWIRFRHLVETEIEAGHSSRAMLSRVLQAFGLSLTELGELFGVSRQAVTEWLDKGVPAERRSKLQTILSVAELLQRKLRPGRLPAVSRKPAEAYGDLSMLQMIAADRHQELLDDVRRSFEWSTTA